MKDVKLRLIDTVSNSLHLDDEAEKLLHVVYQEHQSSIFVYDKIKKKYDIDYFELAKAATLVSDKMRMERKKTNE